MPGCRRPSRDERVVLWLQNSHAAPIPAGTVTLDRMGAGRPVPLDEDVAPYASVALDVEGMLPGLHWPAQIELRAGRHVVRPRYEVTEAGRTRIAHLNVERADLKPDPGIKTLSNLLGRGYLLPFPILPPDRFRSIVLPTPMAERQTSRCRSGSRCSTRRAAWSPSASSATCRATTTPPSTWPSSAPSEGPCRARV